MICETAVPSAGLAYPVSVLAYPMSVLAVLFYATDVADICDGFRIYVRRPSHVDRKAGWGGGGSLGREIRVFVV